MIKYTLFTAVFLLMALPCANAEESRLRLVNFCSSCHGTDGAGPGETIPYIGGQTKEYLATALTEMKNRERYGTLMLAIAQGYDLDEIEGTASWFAERVWKYSDNTVDPALAVWGKEASVTCAACHGETGEGEGIIPKISGQPAAYLFKALMEYKKQLRNNEGNAMMMDEVIDMTGEELQALAGYYSGLK